MAKKKIVVYTIQSKKRYEELLKKKIISGSKHKHVKEYWHEGFLSAYKWMSKQLRINNLPFFAWIKKPDFRQYKKPDNKYVMLTLEIDNYKISHFSKWHFVLSQTYLPKDIDKYEDDIIQRRLDKKYSSPNYLKMDEKDKKIVENSWKRVFKIENEKDLVQVCFESIRLEDVKHVTFF